MDKNKSQKRLFKRPTKKFFYHITIPQRQTKNKRQTRHRKVEVLADWQAGSVEGRKQGVPDLRLREPG